MANHIYKIELLVESASLNEELVGRDVRLALAPLGLFPHISSIKKVEQ